VHSAIWTIPVTASASPQGPCIEQSQGNKRTWEGCKPVCFDGSVHHNAIFIIFPSAGYYSPHCRFQLRSSPQRRGGRAVLNPGSKQPAMPARLQHSQDGMKIISDSIREPCHPDICTNELPPLPFLQLCPSLLKIFESPRSRGSWSHQDGLLSEKIGGPVVGGTPNISF
jgi:hypothetical protein